MSNKQILGSTQVQNALTNATPAGAVGIDMTGFQGASKPRQWLVTVEVLVGASDLYVWGALSDGTEADTADVWGLHQDRFKIATLGKIATALPIGVYHFILENLGVYSRVYFQNSANTVNVKLSEILEAGRGN